MKNFTWWLEKVLTHMNIRMAGKTLKRQVYHWKMHFVAGLIWRVSVNRIMNMHSKFGIPWRKDPRPLSRYLLKNRCFSVGRCIWDISEYELKKLQAGSSTFLHRIRLGMAGHINDSFWVLWAWKKAQRLWIMPRRVQAWAAYRYRHAVDGWKTYLRRYYSGS